MAKKCIAEGWILSLSGTVSFKNARALQEAATLIPDEQLLVETDAPYLTPHPHRGAPNAPYCLPYTVRALAEITGRTADRLAEASSATAIAVFKIVDELPPRDAFVTVS
ncbi:deoxyribonuclease YabD [Mycobacteroides abscessus subsp. abscessus]|nr:deoxyribonuclease YabD [Mycobacteroides abscessus subsp. abscessus]SLC65820.1 deoxyribonuclease YabD [Mycobacteroides abscessus subsp. massiliense]